MRKAYIGDEADCLQMNIYTPISNTNAEKAVLLWIHARGFNYLSGDDGVLGPNFLIENDIILVSFNYRLEPMGNEIIDISYKLIFQHNKKSARHSRLDSNFLFIIIIRIELSFQDF